MNFNLNSVNESSFSPRNLYKNSETFIKNAIQNKLIVNLNKENFDSNILTNTKQYIKKPSYLQLSNYVQSQEIIKLLEDAFLYEKNSELNIYGQWDKIPLSNFISLTIDSLQTYIDEDIKSSPIFSQITNILINLFRQDENKDYLCLKKLDSITNKTGICGIYTTLIKELYFLDEKIEHENLLNKKLEDQKQILSQFSCELVQSSYLMVDNYFNESQIKIEKQIETCQNLKETINFKLNESRNINQMNDDLINSLKKQNQQLKQEIQILKNSNENQEFTQDLLHLINNLKSDVINHKLSFTQNQNLLENIINVFPIINKNLDLTDNIIDMTLNLLIPVYDCKLKWKKNTFNQEEIGLYTNMKINSDQEIYDQNQIINLPYNQHLKINQKNLTQIINQSKFYTENNKSNINQIIQLNLIQILLSTHHQDLDNAISQLHQEFEKFKIIDHISQETTNFFIDNFGISIIISCFRIPELKYETIQNILEIIDYFVSQKDISILFKKQLCSIQNLELLINITQQIQYYAASIFIVRIFKLMGHQISIKGKLLENVLSFLEKFKQNLDDFKGSFSLKEINQIQNNFIK